MILPHKKIEELQPKDIEETLLFLVKDLAEWESFRRKTNDYYMRQSADKYIRQREEKINELQMANQIK